MSELFIVYKLAQSGKTGIIEDMIHTQEENMITETFYDAEELINNIDFASNINEYTANIIITGNSLILSNQTKKRLEVYMEGDIYEMSSKTNSYIEIVENIANKDDNGLPRCRHIVCCSNYVQFKNVKKLILLYFSNKLNVTIYADEIDKYWPQIYSILSSYKEDSRLKVYGFTATINHKMFKDQGNRLNFIHQEINHGPNYVRYSDHNINIIDSSIENEENLEKILYENVDENNPTNILIIPGRTNEEHKNLAKTCLAMDIKPIVMNQYGIQLYKTFRNMLNLSKEYPNKELCDILKVVRNRYNINQPIAVIASSACGGRGVTHQSESFIYDIGIILQSESNKLEAYQSVSRLAHNFKHLIKKPCKIFISEKNDKSCREQEIRILHINNVSKDKSSITLSEYSKAGKKLNYNVTEIYEDPEELKEYLSVNKKYGNITFYNIVDEKYIHFRGEKREIIDFITSKVFVLQDINWGINEKITARCMPVNVYGSIKWVGIYTANAFNIA